MAKTERIQSMTQGRPAKLIFTFAIPLMLGNVCQQLYTVVDTAIVGQALGVNALAALGAADWLNWLVLGVIQGFAQGFSIHMAQRFGANDEEGLNRSIGATISIAAAFSVLLLIVSQATMDPILRAMNTPEEVIGGAFTYLRIMFAGIPIIMAYNVLASILRALGDSRTPLYAMLIASVLNIALDLLFVMVFHWGIAGAVIATVIAQLFAALYCLRAVLRIRIIRLKKAYFLPDAVLTRRLLGLGLPVAAQNMIIAIGGMVVQSVVNRYGVLFVAGFTATNKLYGILEIAATSFGYAVTTYVGQNLGAGLLGRIRRGMHSATWIALLTSAVITAAVLLLGRFMVALFISGTPEEVALSTDVAVHYLNIMSICLSVLYMLHIYRSALMGLGDTVMPMASGIVEFVMRIGVALILPAFLGQEGIYYAEVVAWAGAAILLVATYFVRMKKLERELPSAEK
ncbi:MAG: MATE family efflux transporter [Acutalibacteraceae bacterium]|nr:MATE family efflux transporter [Acutalibacteraceae bacterium]